MAAILEVEREAVVDRKVCHESLLIGADFWCICNNDDSEEPICVFPRVDEDPTLVLDCLDIIKEIYNETIEADTGESCGGREFGLKLINLDPYFKLLMT